MDESAYRVAAQPVSEICKIRIIRVEHRRQAHDPATGRICSAQEPLYQDLVADLAAAEPNHVALVKDDQAHIVENVRILSQSKIKFLWRCDDDRSGRERVDIT
jgi:hypothetical protein